MTKKRRTYTAAVLVAALILLAVVARRAQYPTPQDSGDYLAAVQARVTELPVSFAGWEGTDVPVPTAAISLLRPNAALSRRYVHAETGVAFQLWVVHCGDARDMAGHYPPVCYPNSGWTPGQSRPLPLASDGALPSVEYTFSQMVAGRMRQLVVANLILLPDGQAATTPEQLKSLESDYLNRYRGAAQLQFVFDSSVDQLQRGRAIDAFLSRTESLLNLLRGETS